VGAQDSLVVNRGAAAVLAEMLHAFGDDVAEAFGKRGGDFFLGVEIVPA
jgi:hypothetical protein